MGSDLQYWVVTRTPRQDTPGRRGTGVQDPDGWEPPVRSPTGRSTCRVGSGLGKLRLQRVETVVFPSLLPLRRHHHCTQVDSYTSTGTRPDGHRPDVAEKRPYLRGTHDEGTTGRLR